MQAAFEKRYRIKDQIGHGAFSCVFSAQDMLEPREVAVKMLHERSSLTAKRLLENEAKAMGMLIHPAFPRIYGSGPDFIVMDKIDGEPITKTDIPGIIGFSIEACTALSYLHAKGIVHRDLKPGHLLSGSGRLKVLDLGYCAIRGEEDPATATGHPVGTAQYMAPENTRSPKTVDPRSDIYSLGIIIYEMLSGSPPFEDEDPDRILKMHRYDKPEPLAISVPEKLAAIVYRALAKRPDERFSSAEDMRLGLSAIEGK